MSELIELSAAAAIERIRAGEIDAAELFEAYRARAAADELNAFTWVADAAPETSPSPRSPLAGLSAGRQGPVLHRGVPSQAGSRILEGYRPPTRRPSSPS